MNQDKIWDHFQNASLESYENLATDIVPRSNFLISQAKKVASKSWSESLKVLNIGVGNGWLEKQCLKLGWEVYSLDPSEKSINKVVDFGVKGKVGYIESIPYDDKYFNIVFCSEVLEHLTDEQVKLGLIEINRILVSDGFLMGTVPFNEDLSKSQVICPSCGEIFHKVGHHQSFTVQKLSDLIDTYMIISQVKFAYLPNWSSLNYKGLIVSGLKKVLSMLGVHGRSEKLFFVGRKKE